MFWGGLVGGGGLDPPPPGLCSPFSNQLSYPATASAVTALCRRRERAAYKKQVLGLSSKPAPSIKRLQNCAYFGRTLGSPPGPAGRRYHRRVAVARRHFADFRIAAA